MSQVDNYIGLTFSDGAYDCVVENRSSREGYYLVSCAGRKNAIGGEWCTLMSSQIIEYLITKCRPLGTRRVHEGAEDYV